ncbi:hypothetical protein BH11BAC6_BH11BAC6_17120 [soil metagenome]
MKRDDADITKNNTSNPVRENKPDSIASDKKETDKKGFPFKEKKDKQFDNQEEYIDPASNSSLNE